MSDSSASTAPAQGTPKLYQRVIRQPNGQLRVVIGPAGTNVVQGGAAPAGGAAGVNGNPNVILNPNNPNMVQLRMGPAAAQQLAGLRMYNPKTGASVPLGAGQPQQHAGGIFSNPKVVRFLYLLRNIALFVVAIAILNTIGVNAGTLPTIVAAFVMYKAGMFVLIESIFGQIRSALNSDEAAYELALRRADSMRAPVTRKEGSISQTAATISYGFSCMQGWRRSMEDAHTMILDGAKPSALHLPIPPANRIPTAPSLGAINSRGIAGGCGGFFAVFDGHCGQRVANYCSEHLYHFVTKSPAWAKKDYKTALSEGFVAMDQHLYQHNMEERSGCTAVAVLISQDGKKLYCANAGDSRAILGKELTGPMTAPQQITSTSDGNGNGNGVEALSEDHKPYNRTEQLRIQKAGSVVFNKRVNGILALSRAIGDFSFKKNKSVPWVEQAVTCMPDVKEISIDLEKDQFVVLACDGIWDVRTNEDVAAFVRLRLKKKVALHTICEQLMHACLSNRPFGNGCDNMSVIIVTLDKSNFMKGIGGAVAGGIASPLVRSITSPVVSTSSVGSTDYGLKTSELSTGKPSDRTLLNLDAASNSSTPPPDSRNSSSSSSRRAAPPSLLSPNSAAANAAAAERFTRAAEALREEGKGVEGAAHAASSPIVDVASPSVRASGGGFPPVVLTEEPNATAKPEEEDNEENETADLTGSDGAAGNGDDEEAAERRRQEIASALEDAEVFSPKTPAQFREESATWEDAASAAEEANEDEDDVGGAEEEEEAATA